MSIHHVTVTHEESCPMLTKATTPQCECSFDVDVQCQTTGGCGGWVECSADKELPCHYLTDYEVKDESYETAMSQGDGDGTAIFHGVTHTWQQSVTGWSIPFHGCSVAENDHDFNIDVGELVGGPHAFEADWEDTSVYLMLLRDIDQSAPAPSLSA